MLEQEDILDEVEIVDLLLVPDQLIQGQQQLVQVHKLGQRNQFLGQLLKLMRGEKAGYLVSGLCSPGRTSMMQESVRSGRVISLSSG